MCISIVTSHAQFFAISSIVLLTKAAKQIAIIFLARNSDAVKMISLRKVKLHNVHKVEWIVNENLVPMQTATTIRQIMDRPQQTWKVQEI